MNLEKYLSKFKPLQKVKVKVKTFPELWQELQAQDEVEMQQRATTSIESAREFPLDEYVFWDVIISIFLTYMLTSLTLALLLFILYKINEKFRSNIAKRAAK